MESPIPSSQDLQLEARGLVSIFVTVTMLGEEVKEEEAKRWRGGRGSMSMSLPSVTEHHTEQPSGESKTPTIWLPHPLSTPTE